MQGAHRWPLWIAVLTSLLIGTAMPAFAGPGAQWLIDQAGADGRIARSDDVATAQQATAETLATFAALGIENPAIPAARQFIEAATFPHTGQLARRIEARVRVGESPGELLPALLSHRNADGGFGGDDGHDSTVLDTALALSALSAAGEMGDAAGFAIGYLLDTQGANGAWRAGSNAGSTYLTARVLQALWPYRHRFDLDAGIEAARSYLLAERGADRLWGESHLSALALTAIVPTLVDRAPIQDSLDALAARQSPDGSFGQDVYVTALALRALALASRPSGDEIAISGRVLDSDTGQPMQGVDVDLTGPVANGVATGGDGRFEFRAIPPGSYGVEIARDGYFTVTANTSVAAGDRIDLGDVLLVKDTGDTGATTGTIRGAVTDADTGQPIADAAVVIQGGASASTLPDGRYQLTNVPQGTATVTASAPGYRGITVMLNVPAGGIALFSPSLRPEDGQTPAGAVVTGTVIEAGTGQPLGGVVIDVSGDVMASAQTDAQGRYQISGLAEGEVEITASMAGYDPVVARTNLEENEQLVFSPTLYTSGNTPPDANLASIAGRVVDSMTGQPLAGVEIDATWQAGGQVVTTDGLGLFEVMGISEPGLAGVTLTFSKDGYRTVQFSTQLGPAEKLDIDDVRLRQENVTAVLPDLSVDSVSTESLVFDAQTLAISGSLAVRVKNEGAAMPARSHGITAFLDYDLDGALEPGTDRVLGEIEVDRALASGERFEVDVGINGSARIRDFPISVMVDAGDAVVELSEANNVMSSKALESLAFERDEDTRGYRTVGFNPRDNGQLTLIGLEPQTTYELQPLPSGSGTPESGVLGRLERRVLSLSGIDNFVVDASAPLYILHSHAYAGSSYPGIGTHFHPDESTIDYYGREFVILANTPSSAGSRLAVFAMESATVEVFDKAGNKLVTSPELAAGSFWEVPGLEHQEIYTVRATGRIAVEQIRANGYTQVPPIPASGCNEDCRDDAGERFLFGTVGDGNSAVAVFNPGNELASVALTDLGTDAAVVTDMELEPGAYRYIGELDSGYYELESTGSEVTVWAGSTEGGNAIQHLGDDVSQNYGYQGKRFLLHGQTEGMTIFAGQDGTEVLIDDEQRVELSRDEAYALPGGQLHRIESNKPVVITAVGGTCCYPMNDWSTVLRPMPSGSEGRLDLTLGGIHIRDVGDGQSLALSARVGNASRVPVPQGVEVSFYEGDPASGGTLLGTTSAPELSPGGHADIELEGVTGLTPASELYAVVDSGDVMDECDETNNSHHVPVSVAAVAGGIEVSTDATIYGPDDEVALAVTVTNTGSLAAAYEVELRIVDEAGVSVHALAPIDVATLPSGASTGIDRAWDTDGVLAGDYVVRAVLREPDGDVVGEDTAAFEVVSDTGIADVGLRTTTDKREYHTTDVVRLDNLIRNLTVNTLIEGARLELDVTDPADTVMHTADIPLGQLSPGAVRELSDTLSLDAAVEGVWTVQATVSDTEGTLASDTATFEVVSDRRLILAGETDALLDVLNRREEQTCSDTVTNRGDRDLNGQVLRRIVVEPESGNLAIERTVTLDLEAGESQELAPHEFDTSPLAPGRYTCVLQADIDGEWATLDHAPFEVLPVPVQIGGALSVGERGRILVLADKKARPYTGHPFCGGGTRLQLELDLDTALSPDATLQVRLLDTFGALVDAESLSPGTVDGEINVNAGRPIDIAIPEVGADRLLVTLTGDDLEALRGHKYRLVAEIRDGLKAYSLNSGRLDLTCDALPRLAGTLGDGFALLGIGLGHDNHGKRLGDGVDTVAADTQRAFLKTLLEEAGWAHTIVTDRDSFARALRTGHYTAYLLLNEYEALSEQVQKELRAAVFRGDGLLSAGRHDVFSRVLDEPLGVKFKGTHLSPDGVEFTASPLHVGGQAFFGETRDAVQRVRLRGAAPAGRLIRHGRPVHDTVVARHEFGRGRTVHAGFDLLAEAALGGAQSDFATLLRNAVEHIHPPPDTPVAGRSAPLRLDIVNQGVATPVQADVATSAGSGVLAATAGQVRPDGRLEWALTLGEGATESVDFWVALPVDGSPATVTADLIATDEGEPVDTRQLTYSMTPVMPPGLDEAIAALDAYVAERRCDGWFCLLPGLLDGLLPDAAERALWHLRHARSALDDNRPEHALRHLTAGADHLADIDDTEAIEPIRLKVANAIARAGKRVLGQ